MRIRRHRIASEAYCFFVLSAAISAHGKHLIGSGADVDGRVGCFGICDRGRAVALTTGGDGRVEMRVRPGKRAGNEASAMQTRANVTLAHGDDTNGSLVGPAEAPWMPH